MFKKFIHWVFVLLWLSVIFFFSSQPDLKSSLESYWDFIFRKIAHVSEYFVLSYLSFRAFDSYGFPFSSVLLHSIIFTLFFAAFDELYQTTIHGRVGSLMDVVTDSIGIWCFVLLSLYYHSRRKTQSSSL